MEERGEFSEEFQNKQNILAQKQQEFELHQKELFEKKEDIELEEQRKIKKISWYVIIAMIILILILGITLL